MSRYEFALGVFHLLLGRGLEDQLGTTKIILKFWGPRKKKIMGGHQNE